MATKKLSYFVENENGACRLCTEPDGEEILVQCDECDRWFHLACAKLTVAPSAKEEWLCIKCKAINDQIQEKEKTVKQDQGILELAMVLQNNSLEATRQSKKITLANLPYFDGKPKDWPRFMKAFEESTKEAGFSQLENLNRLLRFLKGEAERSVRALFLDPMNVPAILTRLEEQFGRPDLVYQEMLKEVLKIKIDGQFKIPELSDALNNLVTNVKVMDKQSYLYDSRLIDELVSKLKTGKQLQWMQQKEELEKAKKLVTLEHFNDWLLPIAKRLRSLPKKPERAEKSRNTVNIHKNRRVTTKQKHLPNRDGTKGYTAAPSSTCTLCKGQHKLPDCSKFLEMSAKERFNVAKKQRLCLACITTSSHFQRDCKSAKECGVNDCKRWHHPLLHEETSQPLNYHKNDGQVYFQIVPVTLRNGDESLETYAFLDAGSSLTLMEEEIAKKLGLQGKKDPLIMTWTQNLSVEQDDSRRVECLMISTEGNEYLLSNIRTVNDLQLPKQSINAYQMRRQYTHLKNVPVKSYVNARPTILIGLSHSHLLMPLQRRMGKPQEPMAIKTKLGWMIFGSDQETPNTRKDHFMVHKNEELMNEMIHRYFTTEDFGVKISKQPSSADDEKASEIIKRTLKKGNGYYEVGLLWKQDAVIFPNSYKNAMNRLQSLEKQLRKNPELQSWAKATFNDYVKKGYLRKLTNTEVSSVTSRTYYLPHFIVVNKNKTTPKPRLVFDAAAAIDGVSLNSQLLSGPDEMASLFGVMVRFREGNICVTGDIQEMFHRVRIRQEDQDAQRVLWRDCEQRQPDVFVMQVMTFGATCSPACAQAVKNTNAMAHAETHPLAVDPIIRQHYVDDYLDSFFSLEDAARTIEQVIQVHDNAGFHIRNFTSNRGELLRTIPSERWQKKDSVVAIEEKNENYEKILGIQWNTISDHFSYRVKKSAFKTSSTPTKREVLSFIMSVYDPLGLISHITIHGRILMRAIHIATDDWDALIPDELITTWNECLQQIEGVENLQIPRQLVRSPDTPLDLHTFVDASENAFACCVYARTNAGGTAFIRLIAGKARVAPINPLSIPKLELQAAVLGIRLTEAVKKELRIAVTRSTYWSDSEVVLAWIKNRRRKYQQFVSHRVGEILESSHANQWRWVPSKENPADIATKPSSNDWTWFNGPTFLLEDESTWPQKTSIPDTDEERRMIGIHTAKGYEFPTEDYSSWTKLLKHITILKKFVDYIKNRKSFTRCIKPQDVQVARNMLYRQAQWEAFPEEMNVLSKGEVVPKSSPLNKLMPFIDSEGVLRSRGRLEKIVSIPESTRTPILLPQKPRVVKLLVRNFHEQNLHQADNVVIGALRQTYWILNLRAVLKNVKNCCQKCILRTAAPKVPLMAPLPEFRANPYNPPFTHTGVDYFGPIEVAVKRSVEKRWGTIFTCMSTRAVHIELAEKLDTDSFFVCLKNFQHRRGKISCLYSDNGTNFIGAEKELTQLTKDIDVRMGKEAALKYGIDWKFNPPAAPHFGGSWERLIQSIKKALRFCINEWSNRKPTPETLRATLIKIESMMNSRPLTHIPISTEEEEILTPYHFLIGRGLECAPPEINITTPADRKQWKLVEHHSKIYWDKWKKEYLPTLIKRNKWTAAIEPIKKGDIVVITDDNAPPGKWIKGRITEVHQAADGQVRSVEIKAGNSILKRPAVRVAVINVEQKEHSLMHSSRKTAPKRPHPKDSHVAPIKYKPKAKDRIRPCLWAKDLLSSHTTKTP